MPLIDYVDMDSITGVERAAAEMGRCENTSPYVKIRPNNPTVLRAQCEYD